MGASPATRMTATPRGRAIRRRPLRPWALLAALVVVIFAGYVALAGSTLWREHDATARNAERSALNTARLIARMVSYAVDDVRDELDLAAQSLKGHGHLPPPSSPLTAIAALTSDGRLMDGDEAVALLPAVRQAAASAEIGAFVMHAPARMDDNGLIVPLTLRSHDGTIAAAMSMQVLQTLVDRVELSGQFSIDIGLADGTLLFRAPYRPGTTGAHDEGAPLFTDLLSRAPSGTGTVTQVRSDGSPRLVAYHTVAGTHLVVSVVQPWSAILAEWRDAAVDAAAIGVMVTAVVLALTVALFVWIHRMQAAEEAGRAAEEASRAKSDFLALMSHELRTPLNTVLGFAEMIRDRAWGADAESRYAEYAGDIHAAGTHLLSVLNDVLDLAKIEAGRMTLHPEPLDVHEVARACHRLSSGQAHASGVDIALSVATDVAPLYADPRAVRQMIVNLLSNACKFSQPGGSVRLGIRNAPAGGTLITVSDTGVGMTPEDIAGALQRFGQVDNLMTRAQTGTGLGLPLVKGLAELHGGSMIIDSSPGRGTTVTLTFPPPPPAAAAPMPAGAAYQ